MKTNNILILAKINFQKMFANMFKSNSKKQVNISKNIAIFAILSLFIMASMGTLCYEILSTTYQAGNIKIGLTLLFAFASIFVFLFEVMQSFDVLFKSSDNQTLFALPIKDSEIFVSRILTLVAISYLYQSFIILPTIVCYFIVVGFNVLSLLYFLLMFIFMPLVPIAISAILSLLFGKIGSKQKNNNILKIIVMIVYLLCVFALQYSMNFITQNMSTNSTFANIVNIIFYRGNLFANAISQNILSMLLFVAISCFVFAIPIVIFSKNYRSVCLSLNEGSSITGGKIEFKSKSMFGTLLTKDFKQYFGSFAYVFNTIIGPIFMVLITVYFSICSTNLSQYLSQNSLTPYYLIILAFCFMCGMTIITACSISIEGKRFYIIKSLPVDTKKILWSKICVQLILVLPILILATTITSIFFKLVWWQILLVVGICALFEFAIAIFGLIINIYHPVLDAVNDTVVVKQSFATFITILVGMLSPMLLIGILVLLQMILSAWISLLIIFVLVAILCVILLKILDTKAKTQFENIE